MARCRLLFLSKIAPLDSTGAPLENRRYCTSLGYPCNELSREFRGVFRWSQSQLAATYEHMSEGELLQIANEGGLRAEAKQALSEELHRRKLKASDLPKYKQTAQERLEKETRERWFPLFRYHSLGFGLYGRSHLNDADRESNIQVRTKFFVFVIPLIPIASYRFKCTGEHGQWFQSNTEQSVLHRVPLVWTQVFMTWLTTLLWIGGAIAAIVLTQHFYRTIVLLVRSSPQP